jgi:2-keto-4-pentenoate hydratase/2-oxohepta-3-ene-1,7-dioic acid hydratase in catechol pathway
MRICRFNGDRLGVVRGENILDVTALLKEMPHYTYPFPCHDALVANLSAMRGRLEELALEGRRVPLHAARLMSPVANPGKIVAAPVNYADHVAEALNDPLMRTGNAIGHIREVGLFLKATSSMAGPSDAIRLRYPDRRTDHEIELAVVIGRPADRVSRADALEYVAGYSVGLDITLRGPEERSMRKSLDTFTVIGPWLVTADEIPDPGELDLELLVNGEKRQSSNTRQLTMDVADLIAFASSFYTLMPGDILLTGTPAGVGPLQAGDILEASIEKVGTLRARVARLA